jgi:hypothetical protein
MTSDRRESKVTREVLAIAVKRGLIESRPAIKITPGMKRALTSKQVSRPKLRNAT